MRPASSGKYPQPANLLRQVGQVFLSILGRDCNVHQQPRSDPDQKSGLLRSGCNLDPPPSPRNHLRAAPPPASGTAGSDESPQRRVRLRGTVECSADYHHVRAGAPGTGRSLVVDCRRPPESGTKPAAASRLAATSATLPRQRVMRRWPPYPGFTVMMRTTIHQVHQLADHRRRAWRAPMQRRRLSRLRGSPAGPGARER